jgi:long-chain fatty acid transport protein
MRQPKQVVLLAGTAVFFSLGSTDARADAFALRTQGAVAQGTAFAGAPAGGSPASMFWNPATMTQTPGRGMERDVSGVYSNSIQTPAAGSTLSALGGADNSGSLGYLTSGYTTWQFGSSVWIGLSTNAPFGLGSSFQDRWAGRTYALSANLLTINGAPSVALRINEWLSVGAGVQIQYARTDQNTGIGAFPGAHFNINGEGFGYGATAGITVTPGPDTTIGLGWRSAIDQKIAGNLTLGAAVPFSTPGAVNATLALPDIASLGIRHRIDDSWSVMGTATWTNWSRTGTLIVHQSSGAPAMIGGSVLQLPFQYRDSWFFSGGAEYILDGRTTFRGGFGYETTPITDRVRTPGIPDNDRMLFAAGFTYTMFRNVMMDVGFSHIRVKDSHIDISAASGNPSFNPAAPIAYIGNASLSYDIFTLGFRYVINPPAATGS